MYKDFWLSLLSLLISVGIPFSIFLTRNWIRAWVAQSVQHRFDLKIEEMRADLRKSEEQFKSELRNKEAEIAALRNNVLSGNSNRQLILDKRRFEAAERIWVAIHDLAKYKIVAKMMSSINFKVAAANSTNPNVKKFFETIDETAAISNDIKDSSHEQLFLTELAWALFSAYRAIVTGSYARLQVLKFGIEEPEKLLTNEATKKILKAALPHFSNFIDEQEPESYYYLLDEIEKSLLNELKKTIEGKEANQAAAAQAKEIMAELKKAETEIAPQ